MILIHKQQPHFQPNSTFSHRRLPSAPPSVVVQPTRTPGLLSLSKPAQRPQLQQQRARPSPKLKQAAVAAVEQVNSEKSQQSRGRPQSKPKDKPTRNSSNSSVRGRRNNGRQPSPPFPSQAEALLTPTHNKPNPFSIPDQPPSSPRLVRTAPTLSARPSGKLARRRQPVLVPFELPPAASKAIPVPKRSSSTSIPISRSDPFSSHMPSRKPQLKRKSKSDRTFPICDDLTDDASSDSEDISPPSTPTPSRMKRFEDDGPKTAPLSKSMSGFPFSSPSPLAKKAARRHKRSPSEGIFNMSSDEDLTAQSDDIRALFGLQARQASSSLPSLSSEAELEREMAAAVAAGYFASSTFQNSPSPEELPPPAF
ncbi:hypothetical protein C8J56DRAFT_769379 [Mycena floridula]|nr:hypothetical protein C8J56DRAFT_769379 [Mycena floridula]